MVCFKNKFLKAMALSCIFALTSCSPTSTYISEMKVTKNTENKEKADILSSKPNKTVYQIGTVSVQGTSSHSLNDVVCEAKRKAASEGGDFILLEKSGVEKREVHNPGHSSYQSHANAATSGYADSRSGSLDAHAIQQTNAHSVGPSVDTYYRPWGEFSVWIYAPSRLGIHVNDNSIITGFYLTSDAENNDVKIGDKLLGIDDIDIQDPYLIQHLLQIHPGNSLKLHLERDGVKLQRHITTLRN